VNRLEASTQSPGRAATQPVATTAGWLTAAIVIALGTALLGVFAWDALRAAVETWINSATFNHAFLIAPICAYLIWLRRHLLLAQPLRPDYRGLLLLAAASAAWLPAHVSGTLVVQQFAFVAMVQALVWTVIGIRAARTIAFPLFYLFFAVPFGEFMVAPLQDFTADFVVRALQMLGIPVFLDGIFISIPSGNFEVAEACAGVRFLIATVALGVLCSNVFYRTWWRRAILIAVSVAVPIVANGLRAFGIVMLAHMSDMRVAVGVDHLVYGWIFFAFVTFLLLIIGSAFRERPHDYHPAQPHRVEMGLGRPARPQALVAAGVAAVALSAIAPAYAHYLGNAVADLAAAPLSPPVAASPVTATAPSPGWQPIFRGVDAEAMYGYSVDGRAVDLYIAYYAYQRDGAEVVNSRNLLADGQTWTRVGGGRAVATLDGVETRATVTRMVAGHRGRLVWHWYWVDGTYTASPYIAKLLQVRARLFGGVEAAAVVAVATDYRDSPGDAGPVLQALLSKLEPIGPMLEAASRQRGEFRPSGADSTEDHAGGAG